MYICSIQTNHLMLLTRVSSARLPMPRVEVPYIHSCADGRARLSGDAVVPPTVHPNHPAAQLGRPTRSLDARTPMNPG